MILPELKEEIYKIENSISIYERVLTELIKNEIVYVYKINNDYLITNREHTDTVLIQEEESKFINIVENRKN